MFWAKLIYGIVVSSLGIFCIFKYQATANFLNWILINSPGSKYIGTRNLVIHAWFAILFAALMIFFGVAALVMAFLGVDSLG